MKKNSKDLTPYYPTSFTSIIHDFILFYFKILYWSISWSIGAWKSIFLGI